MLHDGHLGDTWTALMFVMANVVEPFRGSIMTSKGWYQLGRQVCGWETNAVVPSRVWMKPVTRHTYYRWEVTEVVPCELPNMLACSR